VLIGILDQLEVREFIAQILRNFDVGLVEPDKPWHIISYWFSYQHDMSMWIKRGLTGLFELRWPRYLGRPVGVSRFPQQSGCVRCGLASFRKVKMNDALARPQLSKPGRATSAGPGDHVRGIRAFYVAVTGASPPQLSCFKMRLTPKQFRVTWVRGKGSWLRILSPSKVD